MEEQLQKIQKVHDEFLMELFGEVPDNLKDKKVTREQYNEAKAKIEKKHGLMQGHPAYMLWVLQQLGKSPWVYEEDTKDESDRNSGVD